jgi:hypothetical protein
MKRTTCLAVLLSVFVVAPVGETANSGGPASRCGLRTAQTLVVTSDLRVVGKPWFSNYWKTFACFRGSRNRTLVERHPCDSHISCDQVSQPPDEIVVSRRYVGFAFGSCGPGPYCGVTVGTANVRSGRRQSLLADNERRHVAGLDITPTGTIVWGNDSTINGLTLEGETLLFDSGPEVDPLSVALSGNRLYWMRAGEPQTAEVP